MSVLLLLRPILNSLPQRTHDGRWRAKPLSSLASYLLFDLRLIGATSAYNLVDPLPSGRAPLRIAEGQLHHAEQPVHASAHVMHVRQPMASPSLSRNPA